VSMRGKPKGPVIGKECGSPIDEPTGATVLCRICARDVTKEALAELGEEQFGGSNLMRLAEPWPEPRIREFLQTYVCFHCTWPI
jgi:hypothetical protein